MQLQLRIRGSALSLLLSSLVLGSACNCGSPGIRSRTPAIAVSPAALVFQPIAPGSTSLAIVKVSNVGNADLHFEHDPVLAEAAAGAGDYLLLSLLDHDCAGQPRTANRSTIAAGECARVVVKYAPLAQNADTAQLTLSTDDPDHPTVTVPISLGAAEKVKICTLKSDGSVDTCDSPSGAPPSVDFGLVSKGQSATRTFRVFNAADSGPLDGIALLAPDGQDKLEYVVTSPRAPTSLAAGMTFDVTIRFNPTANGLRPAWIELSSNDAARPAIKVPLAGRSDGPAICASPDPVDFGTTSLGVEVDKTVTLTSCGTVPVQLLDTSFNAFASPAFGHTTSFPGAQTLQPGHAVSVGLSFVPQEAGDATGLLLDGNDGLPTQVLRLVGNAIVTPACHLESSVSKLDFGQVVKGQSLQKAVSVANRGLVVCNLSGAAITQGSATFSVLSAPSATVQLRPGDAYTLTAQYAPPASDGNTSDSGTLEFTSDDPQAAHLDVALTGEPVAAAACKLNIFPSAGGANPFGGGRVLNFGNISVGHPKVLSATFSNVGSAPCSLSSGSLHLSLINQISGGGACNNSGCLGYSIIAPFAPASIAPGQTTSIQVQFAPQNSNQTPLGPDVEMYVETGDASLGGECIGALPFDNNPGCAQIGLTGQGDVSNLAVLPSDLDFGLTTLGCNAQQEKVTLYNTGSANSFTIKSLTLAPTGAPFYIQAPPTPFTMAAGTQVPIYIKYKPTQAARETATLSIESDASNATSKNPYVTVGLAGSGTTNKHQTDTFNQSATPKVDLLFVIDDSGSFGFYQDQLSQQATNFVNAALKYNADYQIGVSSNDVVQQAAGGGESYPGDIYPGGLYGQPAIISNSTPNPASAFSKNVKIGTNGTAKREAGLELAWDVLTAPANQLAPPQGSVGFLRPDARLVVIDVQDDDDESNATTGFYVDFFKSLKGQYNAGLVSFNAIGSFDQNGMPSQCIANDTEPGGQRYYEVAQGTGGKTWSLCTVDWGAIADELALSAFAGRSQFPLSRVADPATIVVTLNGVAEVNGVDYTYDQPSNSLVFKAVPAPGATIVADYDALCF